MLLLGGAAGCGAVEPCGAVLLLNFAGCSAVKLFRYVLLYIFCYVLLYLLVLLKGWDCKLCSVKLTNAVAGLELYALVLLSLVVLSCCKTNKCCCRAGPAGCSAVEPGGAVGI